MAASAAAQAQLPSGVRLRTGGPADAPLLYKAVLREKMNPLGLRPERFTVAEREGSNAVVGFGQARKAAPNVCFVRPLGLMTAPRRPFPTRSGRSCPAGAAAPAS